MKTHSLKQPKAFHLIFMLEFWERFGYYGVQALIVLFMVSELGYTDRRAEILYTSFAALAFLMPALGGYVGDKLLGTKRTTIFGALTLALGYLLLSIPEISNQNILLPLAIIAVGNGLFKANPSSLLSKAYAKSKMNSDSGFTLYYMAVNAGALISMFFTPIISKYLGWHTAYLVCFLGLVLVILTYTIMRNMIADIGSKPDFEKINLKNLVMVILGALIATTATYWLLNHNAIMSWLLIIGTIALFMIFFSHALTATENERKGMLLFAILFFQAIVFFVLYFQMPTSLNLFTLRNINHSFFGVHMEPASYQALNPFWIIVMSPILAIIYQKLSQKNKDLSIAAKFALGTFLAGSAFLVLPLGGMFAEQGIVSSSWIVLSYFLQSTGELLVSALGLSLVSRYIPQRLMGYTMGMWFLSTSIASIVAGEVASIASIPKGMSTDPIQSLPIYNHLFLEIGITTVIIALIMGLFVPRLNKLERESQCTNTSIPQTAENNPSMSESSKVA